MTRATMACWLSIAMLLLAGTARGQSFDFSFSTSTGTYQSISGATTIASGTNWDNNRYRIPIGYSFGFNGQSFDSLTIVANGIIQFDNDDAVVLFHGAGCKKDSNNVYSILSYSTTGTTGNKILKVQYTNTGYDKQNPGEYLNYQLWLYQQDNKIEIHTGSTSYPGLVDSTGISPTPLVGLINPMQNETVNGMLISGDAAAPSPQSPSQGGGLYYLDFVPPSGRIYTFTPNGN